MALLSSLFFRRCWYSSSIVTKNCQQSSNYYGDGGGGGGGGGVLTCSSFGTINSNVSKLGYGLLTKKSIPSEREERSSVTEACTYTLPGCFY